MSFQQEGEGDKSNTKGPRGSEVKAVNIGNLGKRKETIQGQNDLVDLGSANKGENWINPMVNNGQKDETNDKNCSNSIPVTTSFEEDASIKLISKGDPLNLANNNVTIEDP